MSQPYFADGPRIIIAAKEHSYVIQPPGYWLYCRTAALFTDPAFGLDLINSICAGLGAMVFYLVTLHLTTRWTARLAVLAYSAIFYGWFAGSTQSSYGGQLLIPALFLFFMFRYVHRPSLPLLFGVAVSYTLIGGVRPSDGAFLLLALLYFAIRYVPVWRDRILLIGVAGVLCLFWFVPQRMALAALPQHPTNLTQIWPIAKQSAPILLGFDKRALSNILRVVIPMGIAFWSLLPAILLNKNEQYRKLLWVWIIPGLAFFTLFYISDAPYLCYLTPALILLALSSRPRFSTTIGLALCIICNVAFFLLSRPAENPSSLAAAVYTVNGPRYDAWALRHQWYRRLNSFPVSGGGKNEGALAASPPE